MNLMFFISLSPLLPIMLSIALLLKKPFKPSNLSSSMTVALLGFGICAYFGNQIVAASGTNLFWSTFGILTIYCVVAVSMMMHFAALLREAKKRMIQSQQETNQN